MNIEEFLKAVTDAAMIERQKYHVTLGALIENLRAMPPQTLVTFDNGMAPVNLHSYRGYYSDLAFEGTEKSHMTAAALLNTAEQALGATFEGYKGGDFVMTEKTPLWAAAYGSCGRAIVSIVKTGEQIVLVTKEMD